MNTTLTLDDTLHIAIALEERIARAKAYIAEERAMNKRRRDRPRFLLKNACTELAELQAAHMRITNIRIVLMQEKA